MSEENVEIVKRLYARWEGGDLSFAGHAFDSEVVFVRTGADLSGTGLTGEWRGMDEMSEAVREWLRSWENLRVEAERFYDLGDRVLVLERQSGVGKRSGVPLDHGTAHLITMRNGSIVRWEAFWDRTDALKAAGLAE